MNELDKVIDDLMEEKLHMLHTAFLAQVVKVTGNTATIQSYYMTKNFGEDAKDPAIIENVPILKSALPVQVGDKAFIMCAERDITNARRGIKALPARGRHQLKDAVIVGVLA